ncbi:unnamed protein product [Aureobasidium vineae]|uniref:Uncharacterized protein n=1 Tax=Aureobasidium vineae TaxID=2773715 RepID=A0A9N8PAX5_9PEZI|nr:unnamed protein product [Aureobasidium vineae]
MARNNTPTTPSRSSPAREPTTYPLPPTTPASRQLQPKAHNPSNRYYTYKKCVANDKAARARAKSLVKQSDQYVYEMSHEKREQTLTIIANEVDAKRIRGGEHVSCLFEEEDVEEMPLSPEEAAEKWETTRREIAAKVSGVRGVVKHEVRMLPKKMAVSGEKVSVEEGEEDVGDLAGEVASAPELVTSKGIPVIMIDND